MDGIEKNRVGEIQRLHGEILNSLKMSLEKGIRIGELLADQKEVLKHGEFTAWVNDNLPFTDRTARNYMRLFQERDRLKMETVSDLTAAYRLLIENKSGPKIPNLENIERAISFLGEVKEYIGEIEDTEELWKIHELAKKIENCSRETHLTAAWNLGRIEQLPGLLNTDYYEFTEVGLKRLRELTKEEWEEYGERLRLACLSNERR
jgi:hypothetical protein